MSLELRSLLLAYPNSCLGASPHQQGRDTKMLSFCGIDVSKDRLDVMVLPAEQCCSVPNDAGGWTALVERLRNFSTAAIGIEVDRARSAAHETAHFSVPARKRPWELPRRTDDLPPRPDETDRAQPRAACPWDAAESF